MLFSMSSHNPLTRGKKQKASELLRAERLDEAKTLLEKVCATDRRDAEAWYMLGAIHERQGRANEAETCYHRAAELDPGRAEIHYALGNAQFTQHRLDAAVASYRRVLEIQPDLPEAHTNLGVAFESLGKLDDAARSYESACHLDPKRAESHYNLANVLRQLGRHEEAIGHYREALRLRADFVDALVNLGIALIHGASHASPASRRAGLLEESVAMLQHAVRLKPGSADGHNNLAVSLRHLGRIEEAVESYRRVLVIDPQHEDAHEGLATAELLLGHFDIGWAHYRYRLSMRMEDAISPPPTLPPDLTGKWVLAVHDQGLGDELFFLRFAKQLKERGAHIAYRPHPKLAKLLARVDVIDHLLAPHEDPSRADWSFSIGDLPWLLGMERADQIPSSISLTPLPERLETLMTRLAAFGSPPYIGVTWRAGDRNKAHVLYKECPLPRLAEALRAIPATVLVLQHHPTRGEIDQFAATLGHPVHDLSALNDDLESMLALLSLLDDYVGVSNTNMHLRAEVGKTARVLVPAPPEWRWMAGGKESPWFPGFTVYRQGYDGAWEKAFDALGADLNHLYGR